MEALERWKTYGVVLERSARDGDRTALFISVPSVSDFCDELGNELSGMLLAKRIKRDIGAACLLRCRVRQERWTAAKAANVENPASSDGPARSQTPWDPCTWDQKTKNAFQDLFGSIFGGKT